MMYSPAVATSHSKILFFLLPKYSTIYRTKKDAA